MDINEVNRGMVYRDDEAKKEKLTGEVRVILDYQAGGIARARIEKTGPLIPGAPRKPPLAPLDTDARDHHGG